MVFDLEGGNVMTKAYPDMKAYPNTEYLEGAIGFNSFYYSFLS